MEKKTSFRDEAGVAGYKIASGYVYDEFLNELRGIQGRRKLREMSDNDPIIGSILSAIKYILRSVEFHVDGDNEELNEFVEKNLFHMPDMSFDDALSDALSNLIYGFALQEMVFMRDEDGYYCLKKLAPRSQETIWEWDADNNGDIKGFVQYPPTGSRLYVPYEKVLHFRTDYNRGNPEGRSILRNAYRSYHFVKNLSMIEAIAAERELNGLPVMKVPSAVFSDASKLEEYTRIVRDVKFNEQGGLVLPSDLYTDTEGNPTNEPLYKLELLSSNGSRNIDTGAVITRHEKNMARTILADFIMLGDGAGSYALSENKSDLFLQAIKSVLGSICSEYNRKLIPTIARLNGFDPAEMPQIRHGNIAPDDLGELGDFVAKLAGAGLLLNDEDTENHLRRVAGLPEAEKDILDDA